MVTFIRLRVVSLGVLCTSDSTLLYSIHRYFNPDGVVLSNDGLSILFAKRSIPNSQKGNDESLVLFYRKGVLELTYDAGELIVEDSVTRFSNFFYHNINLYHWDYDVGQRVYHDTVKPYMQNILEDPFYGHDEMAYIATRDNELLKFNLNNGKLISRTPLKEAESVINNTFNKQKIIKPEFEIPTQFGLPNLANGMTYEEGLEDKFNMISWKGGMDDQYKYYDLSFLCLINSDGQCLESSVEFEDSLLNGDIESFFLNAEFDHTEVPEIIEKFYFSGVSFFRKADDEISKQERLIEKEKEHEEWLWRIKQDYIDGVYIPTDLDDCMKELDSMLSDHIKEDFKSSDPIMYHMGLGRWIRNYWGLWGGSRLERYFVGLGVTHPDNMSGIILRAYHRHINDNPINTEELFKYYNASPKLEYRVDTVQFKW